MPTCYQHPKLEAVGQCRRCKLQVCCHCRDGEYCPDCVMLNRYVELGYTGRQKPRLIEMPEVRSKTKELMIARLQAAAFDPDAASIAEAKSGKRPLPRRQPLKTHQPLGYGAMMPGLSPLIRVTRSPWSRAAAIAVTAFGLGSFFAHPRTTLAEPVGRVAQAQPAETLEMAPVHVGRKPEVPLGLRMPPPIRALRPSSVGTQLAYHQVAAPLRPAIQLAAPQLISRYSPAIALPMAALNPPQAPAEKPGAAVPAPTERVATPQMRVTVPIQTWAAPKVVAAPPAERLTRIEAPHVAIAFPSPGGTLRATSYVQVRISNPAHLKEVFLMLDGHPVPATLMAKKAIDVPLDTTSVRNGDHYIQVIAHQEDGNVVHSDEIPIAIFN